MNKLLVDELASQATDDILGVPVLDRYRFAELIVSECAELYNHNDVMAPVGQSAYGEAYQDGWINGTKAYRQTILEHFRVG